VKNKNILIIEDDSAMVKLFELIAKKSGFNVISASNGSEGLKKLSQQEFILVITDLKMPVMNGVDFIKQARKIPKFMNFPFVVVTGNLKEFSADVALLGNVTLLEKPLKQIELKELLDNTLKISSGETVSTVPEEEVISFLKFKLEKISSLMLEVITKIKPQLNILEKIPENSFFEGHYFASHLLIFQNLKLGIIFNFDKGISDAIASGIAQGNTLTPEVVLESLSKVSIAMMKKIPENSPYAGTFTPSIPISLIGNENKNLFGTLKNNFIANIYAKNEKGILTIHLLKLISLE
jgi:two-component system, chemotaxis family, chemotaxis protein CheY